MRRRVNRECIVCSGDIGEHSGHGMCSKCLRLHKRKTKPSYYLGTCYSEISRRCKTFDSTRPNYFGLEKCSREEFINKFVVDKTFLKLFNEWRKNNFRRGHAPSIHRLNHKLGYTLDNTKFIRHKDHKPDNYNTIPVYVYKNKKIIENFDSITRASKKYNISRHKLSYIIKNDGEYNNFTFKKVI